MNLCVFPIRKHAGNHLVNAYLLLNGCGSALIVAGEHDRTHAKRFHFTHSLFACGFHLICDGNHAEQLTAPCEEQRRFTLLGQFFSFRFENTQVDSSLVHHGRIAAECFGSFCHTRQTSARDLTEVLYGQLVALLLFGIIANRSCQRMLAFLFEPVCQHEQIALFDSFRRNNIGDFRCALRDGARLVEHHGRDVVRILKRFGTLDENTLLGATTSSDHDSCWSRKPERTRTADDEHRDAMHDGLGDVHARNDKPNDENNNRYCYDHRHEHAAYTVGQAFDRRFRTRCIVNELNDMRERSIVAHVHGAHLEVASGVDCRTCDFVARNLVHRHALPRERRFVDDPVPFEHDAIDGHALAGAYHKHVTHLNALDGNLLFSAVIGNDRSRLGRKVHKRCDGVCCAALRTRFEVFSKRDERENHARALEIQIHGCHMRFMQLARPKRDAHVVQLRDAIDH